MNAKAPSDIWRKPKAFNHANTSTLKISLIPDKHALTTFIQELQPPLFLKTSMHHWMDLINKEIKFNIKQVNNH